MQTLYTKRPDDRLDYDVDFATWLTPGDVIASVDQVTVTGSEAESDENQFTGTAVKVWLIGGVDGETAHVTVEVTTEQGRVKEHCFKVRIRERC